MKMETGRAYVLITDNDGQETKATEGMVKMMVELLKRETEVFHCGDVYQWHSALGPVTAMPAKPKEKRHRLTWPVTRTGKGYTVKATAKGFRWFDGYGDSYTAWVTGWIDGLDYGRWCADYDEEVYGHDWTEDDLIRLIEDAATVTCPGRNYRGVGQWYTESPWLRIAPNGRFILYMSGGRDV